MKTMIRIKKRFALALTVLLFGLIFTPRSAAGRQMEESKVRAAVQTWVRSMTADARPDALVERMEPCLMDGETVAYLAHLSGGGYCVCGADDRLLPVYFYCPHGTADADAPWVGAIVWEIGSRRNAIRERLVEGVTEVLELRSAFSERADLWQDLQAGRVPGKRAETAAPSKMELDLTCQWSQNSPYNDQCPNLTPGRDERTLVGCVATTAAQLMYYWQWPNTGEGSASVYYPFRRRSSWDETALTADPSIPSGWSDRLTWTSASGGRLRMNGYWDDTVYGIAQNLSSSTNFRSALSTLYERLTRDSTLCSANFGSTTYDWSLLQDTHTDPSDAGDQEAAELCFQVGVACDMDYGKHLSLSDLYRAENPLENNFGYDPDAVYGIENASTMVQEIQWLRPLGLSGGPPGHAWVIYGYDLTYSPNRFKMNMGWGGNSDGWYTLDDVPQNINKNHNHLTRVAPNTGVEFVGGSPGGDGSPAEPYENIESALQGAADNSVLIFKAGSDNTFSSVSLTVSRPLTLKGTNAVIRKN